jgi:coproporphyrinogen III oxidase
MAATIDTQAVKAYLLDLQDRITSATGAVDGKSFATDSWEKPKDSKLQGSGRTCIYRQPLPKIVLRLPGVPLRQWAFP